jgi:hypothetical protein
MKHALLTTALMCSALLGASAPAQAQARGAHGHRPEAWQLDARYHHDHYYPRPGYVVPAVPGGAISISYHGGSYFFHGGVWFRPVGPRFVVVAPPIGIVVPLLPPSYTTLWIGGVPYYYANGAYYVADGPQYRVVQPPPGADDAKPAPVHSPRAAPDPILYPRNGQSAEQTEADRRECNRWATTQQDAMNDASIFKRAVEACMDGRGYTVR